MEQDFIFQLSEEFEFTNKGSGDFEKTASIEFVKPGMEVYSEISSLSQSVMAAMLDAKSLSDGSEADAEAEEAEFDANAVKIMLLNSSRVKLSDVAKEFRAVVYKTATFDGKNPVKEAHIDKFDINEFNRMMCEYVANFIAPSLLSGMEA